MHFEKDNQLFSKVEEVQQRDKFCELKRSVYSLNEIDRDRNDNVRLTLPKPPADQSLTTDIGFNTGTNTSITSFNIPITTIFFPPFSIGGALTS